MGDYCAVVSVYLSVWFALERRWQFVDWGDGRLMPEDAEVCFFMHGILT